MADCVEGGGAPEDCMGELDMSTDAPDAWSFDAEGAKF